MKKLLLVLICLIFTTSTFAQKPYTHCQSDEVPVVSCSVGKKILSLCASNDLSQNSGYLQYKFGIKDKIEFIYPKEKIHPKGIFIYGSQMLIGGGADYVKFKNSNIQYLVYSYIRDQRGSEGVAVYKNNKLLKDFECKSWVLDVNWGPVYSAELTEDNQAFETPW